MKCYLVALFNSLYTVRYIEIAIIVSNCNYSNYSEKLRIRSELKK